MRAALVYLWPCLALGACSTVSRPAPVPAPVVRVQCLPMVTYSPAEQAAAAAELSRVAPGGPSELPTLARMITDYGAMRAANRACLATR